MNRCMGLFETSYGRLLGSSPLLAPAADDDEAFTPSHRTWGQQRTLRARRHVHVVALGLAAVLVRSVVAARRSKRQAAQLQQGIGGGGDGLLCVLPLLSLPLVGFPSALLTPVAFALRMAVRSGVRLAVLSGAVEDAALGAVALCLSAAYIAHVAFAVSPCAGRRQSGASLMSRRALPSDGGTGGWRHLLGRRACGCLARR